MTEDPLGYAVGAKHSHGHAHPDPNGDLRWPDADRTIAHIHAYPDTWDVEDEDAHAHDHQHAKELGVFG